jgi:hypothetical protein
MNVNPGLFTTFTWLSNIASNFERYKFTKLQFTYVSAAATSERGRVALAFQYDPTAGSPLNRTDFFSVVPNVEEAPWEDIAMRVAPVEETRYIRSSGVGGTLNTYDIGKLLILTAMNANNTTQLGEIFVEYTVELYNPQFQTVPAGEMDATATSAADPMGTSELTRVSGNSPITWKTGGQIYLGTSKPLLMVIVFIGTGLTQASPVLFPTSGSAGARSIKYNTTNTAGTTQVIIVSTKNTQPLDYLSFDTSVSTTITTTHIYVGDYIEV